MTTLNLKPTHKVIKSYYSEIEALTQQSLFHEGAVAPHFASLLRHCANKLNWNLAEQVSLKIGNRLIRPDGILTDSFNFRRGIWEAKDTKDDLEKEVKEKFAAGYPKENILFQSPEQMIIWQDNHLVFNENISEPAYLIEGLKLFFSHEPKAYREWGEAVEAFKDEIPEIAGRILKLIEEESRTNKPFARAFENFANICRESVNPNLSSEAIREMLIQHLLTERIFRTVFNHPDFINKNIIAHEIEKVIAALTSRHFSRGEFLKPLDRFYKALEMAAATIGEYAEKQSFLNTVYEKFFQGFSVRVADTHGIVYTPQPVVAFMVKSVEHILQKEFGKSLSDKGVHILDPFVGTGNFILRVIREIKKTALEYKYANELHCNEVLLLPYYIASMNIEHEYFDLTGTYQPFEGICLADTFELAEKKQFSIFVPENTDRITRQKETPIFVIIGNPPYNAGQVNENDNNKNRKYKELDRDVAETYTKDSKATNKNALSDVYVKAIKWASERIAENKEGVIAFITNNGFVDGVAFDGMRKHLAQDFNRIYILDLKGNVRKDSMREGIPIGEKHTVFGLSAMVGISVTFFIKCDKYKDNKIFYSEADWKATRQEKFDLIEKAETISGLEWKEIIPDKKYNWLTDGLQSEFETFLAIAPKKKKQKKENVIFSSNGYGVQTNRDSWVCDFNYDNLTSKVRQLLKTYNSELYRWNKSKKTSHDIDSFVLSDETKIKWSSRLKECLLANIPAEFNRNNLRKTLYRPFCKLYLYFDSILVHRRGQSSSFFPVPASKNYAIGLSGISSNKPFQTLMTDAIPIADMLEKTQCFPFYTYNEDGTNQQENITDWALEQFRTHYKEKSITKWDIFHYVYAILHHPEYREKYAANLKRELPRIPFVNSHDIFKKFVNAGKKLADLHVNYGEQPEYPLNFIEKEDTPLNWKVEKMKLSKDKTALIYNDFLTLSGIPRETFEYRLGNRSALEWVIDQYRIKTDKRSGITNDPNQPDNPQYIVQLIGKVIFVSIETVKIVKKLPELLLSLCR